MSGAASELRHRLNPHYGSGAMQRRIELVGAAGAVTARLVDSFHEMSCRVEHDGARVTATSGQMPRIPTTSCPGAIVVLEELVGLPLDTPAAQLYADGRARRHCTHLFDLAVLALAHGRRGATTRRYETRVPDELETPVEITLDRDGARMISWQAFAGAIVAPSELGGRPLRAGFAQWATRQFAGDELEAAMILARTYAIAPGRRYDIDAWAGRTTGEVSWRHDVCYSYAKERGEQTVYIGGNLRESP